MDVVHTRMRLSPARSWPTPCPYRTPPNQRGRDPVGNLLLGKTSEGDNRRLGKGSENATAREAGEEDKQRTKTTCSEDRS